MTLADEFPITDEVLSAAQDKLPGRIAVIGHDSYEPLSHAEERKAVRDMLNAAITAWLQDSQAKEDEAVEEEMLRYREWRLDSLSWDRDRSRIADIARARVRARQAASPGLEPGTRSVSRNRSTD